MSAATATTATTTKPFPTQTKPGKETLLKPLDDGSAALESRAVQLRSLGHTYDEIAQQLGLATRGSAWKIVQRALTRIPAESVEEMRLLEGARLDAMSAAIWPTAVTGDEKAILVMVRIMERRARLFGLDAPVRMQNLIDNSLSGDVDQEVQRLIARMQFLDSAEAEGLLALPPNLRQTSEGDGEA